MGLIRQEHVFKIYSKQNNKKQVTSQHKDLTSLQKDLTRRHKDLKSQHNYLTSGISNMPPYDVTKNHVFIDITQDQTVCRGHK